jgi:hypothetical protein
LTVCRAIFLAFMTWLLVVFLPSHTRGRITMGPKSSDDCCAPAPPVVEDDCCTPASPTKKHEPSSKDRANCAVCFWAAGLLSDIVVTFDHDFAERAFEQARNYNAQVRCVASRLTHHGRDPPATALI